MKENERLIFEKGFEEGYGIAKRNYEVAGVHIVYKTQVGYKQKKLEI